MSLNNKQKVLLAIDALVNLILGSLLLSLPAGMLEFLGLPAVAHYFYTTILGAVIFGIGIALLIDLFGASRGVRGLGLGGAIAINLCGGGVLFLWLIFHSLKLPLRGHIILWTVAVLVLAVGLIELVTGSWKKNERH